MFLGFLICWHSGPIALANEEELEVDLFFSADEIVLSPARHAQEIQRSPSAVTVITRRDIETFGATTFADIFRMVPGVDVILATSSYSAVTTRSYWNYENRHFLVLIDGREANLEILGMTPWEGQPVALEEVERIEIIRGPGASLYGANALTGVINITTRSIPERDSVWYWLDAGQHGDLSLVTGASLRLDDIGFSLVLGRDVSDRFLAVRESMIDSNRLRSRLEFALGNTRRLVLEGGLTQAQGNILTSGGFLRGDFGTRYLRLTYEDESIRSQIYWNQVPIETTLDAPLLFEKTLLASIAKVEAVVHCWDAQFQFTLPTWFPKWLIMLGGDGRLSFLHSDSLLDRARFEDPQHPHFQEPGIRHWEVRAGGFVHTEFRATDWLDMTTGLRFDANSETSPFLSPRFALLIEFTQGQVVRLGIARSFFMPAFLQRHAHPSLEFPADSPIQGSQQDAWLEFMSRAIGNQKADNEKLWAFEIGYRGTYFQNRLHLSWELYANLYEDILQYVSHLEPDPVALIDLQHSYMHYENSSEGMFILGSELTFRVPIQESLEVLGSWTHRQIYLKETSSWANNSPKNLLSLGCRFHKPEGLRLGLWGFVRSGFVAPSIQNPEGLLAPQLEHAMHPMLVLLARFGWKWGFINETSIETGMQLFAPLTMVQGISTGGREFGGGVTPHGLPYGGEWLVRSVSAYLTGSF